MLVINLLVKLAYGNYYLAWLPPDKEQTGREKIYLVKSFHLYEVRLSKTRLD